jgi:hypothetical protein
MSESVSVETKLAMAAAFKGTLLDRAFVSRKNLRNIILADMQDYFHYEPVEASQFNAEKVLGELTAVPDDQEGYVMFLDLLGEIGFRSVPWYEAMLECRMYKLESLLWHEFIDEAVDRWNREKKAESGRPAASAGQSEPVTTEVTAS